MTPPYPPQQPPRRPAWPAAVGGVAVGTLITATVYLAGGQPAAPLVPSWVGTPAPAPTQVTSPGVSPTGSGRDGTASPRPGSGRTSARGGSAPAPTDHRAGTSPAGDRTSPAPGGTTPGGTTSGGTDRPGGTTQPGSAPPSASTAQPGTWPTLPRATLAPATVRPSPSSSPRRGGTAAASPAKGTAVDVTDDLERGIVLIEGVDGAYTSAGTGMILTPDGLVLTNYHVVRSTTEVSVQVAASGRRFGATLVGRDATRDVALLRLKGAADLDTITPDRDPVGVGDPVVAAGNAAGQGYLTAFSGSVLATGQSLRVKGSGPNDPDQDLRGLIQTDAHAEPGDSGGPLFDAQQEVLGMTTAGAQNAGTGRISSAFAVPIGDALEVVDQIRSGHEGGSVVIGPKPSLGIMAVSDAQGVLVKSVSAGSAADKAGITSGSHISKLGDDPVAKTVDLARALDRYQPGDTASVEWTTAKGVRKTAQLTFDASDHN